jgi:hypothetical protein
MTIRLTGPLDSQIATFVANMVAPLDFSKLDQAVRELTQAVDDNIHLQQQLTNTLDAGHSRPIAPAEFSAGDLQVPTPPQKASTQAGLTEGPVTVEAIKKALAKNDRELAVLLWQNLHAVNGKLADKKTLYDAADVRRCEFGKWERGERGLPVGGRPDKRIRAVLLSPAL